MYTTLRLKGNDEVLNYREEVLRGSKEVAMKSDRMRYKWHERAMERRRRSIKWQWKYVDQEMGRWYKVFRGGEVLSAIKGDGESSKGNGEA